MVFTNPYAKVIVDTFPKFSKSVTWKEHLIFWGDDNPTNIFRMSEAFKQYLIDEILQYNEPEYINEAKKIFNFIEYSVCKYENYLDGTPEKDFSTAIYTVILESLLNHASNGNVEYSRFIPFLGENSKKFCKDWDKFTGVRSIGLWDDAEWESAGR